MQGLFTIMNKELRRVFKDRKMVFSMFIMPVVMVIGICVLLFALISNMTKDIENHVPVVYVQNAPADFQGMLKEDKVEVTYLTSKDSVDQVKTDILNAVTDLLIVFPEDFTTAVENATGDAPTLPQVMTFYNPSEDYSSEARTKYVSGYLESYRQYLIANRFGSAEYAQIFLVDSDNSQGEIQDDAKATGKMIGMFVPYFITIMLFAGAMALGVDTITGEKERGTLASLLLTPLKRTHIVLGKIFALSILSVLSAMVYVVAMVVAIPVAVNYFGAGDAMSGLTISFSPLQIIQILVLIVGIVLMYVAMVAVVAVFSKTVKEAQTYVGLLYMAVMVSGMITMYTSDATSLKSYLIPVYNTSAAFKGIFTQEITGGEFLIAAGMTYCISGILTVIIAKAFKSEKVMFNA